MANKRMWAWTDIKHTIRTENRTDSRLLKCGNEAVQSKMGLTDEQWEELVTTKAIRPIPYPVPPSTNPVSPVSHFRKIARAIENDIDDPELLASVLPPIQDNTPTKPDPAKVMASEAAA